MIWWGAIWGGFLGLIWPGHEEGLQAIVGGLLGALAGLTLRRSIRTEIERQVAARAGAAGVPRALAERTDDDPAGHDVGRPGRAESGPTEDAAGAPPWSLEDQARAEFAEQARRRDARAAGADTARARPAPRSSDDEPAFADTQPLELVEPTMAPVSARSAAATEADAPGLAPKPPGTGWVERARAWLLGGNTVVRLGVLVLFIGLAFLARYAVEQSLLPPELRVAAIGLAGIALFIAGWRLRNRSDERQGYALTLQGAGVGVLYLAVFAAFRLYQFLPAGAAFAALALVCAFSAVIALAQNAMPMAFIGFAGGYAAPLLVSSGQGSHVGLFGYYLVLGVAIAAIAWARAWRALNLLGFFATFAVATAWGVLKYRPEHYASTQPFLVGFFVIFLAASLFYALRHRLAARRAVDATMIFGVPLIGFGLQAALTRPFELGTALSALAFGGVYLVLAAWVVRRGEEVGRWLAECFLALGLGFVTLAVPLAMDARWTSAVWAVEGAAVYWMGRRQDRWLARLAGLLLQGLGAFAYLSSLQGFSVVAGWPFAHPGFVGAALLAASALAIGWWLREPLTPAEAGPARALGEIESRLGPVAFWAGFLWWQFALDQEIVRHVQTAAGALEPVWGAGARLNLHLLGWVLSAWLLFRLTPRWSIAATPAWTLVPVMLFAALQGAASLPHAFVSGGWIAWPLALAAHAHLLRRADGGQPAAWWPWVHAGGVWLLVLLAAHGLSWAVGRAELWQTAWAAVILLVAATAVLLGLSHRRVFSDVPARWPLNHFARAYGWLAAAPVAGLVAAGSVAVAVHSSGQARPLPYVPLINPTDLAVALGLAACARWWLRLRASDLALPDAARSPRIAQGLALMGFVALNTVWLRVAHHYGGVPWRMDDLAGSFLVQAGYSILWTLVSLGLMFIGHRRRQRPVWTAGAGLLGLTLIKLFLVDLSNRGGSERIIVFIAVGALMLVIGYLAPLPPKAATAEPGPTESP